MLMAEVGYVLTCTPKEEKKVVLKMLLSRRVKAQQEIKRWFSGSVAFVFNFNIHLYGFVSLFCFAF